ncbi:hypothetical protein GQ53DRAFT_845680 [Thozetella sp. PMI_491]|nr:hypothetical protein GQ53DRAFT_845680 [Thozetella sp. PMI_491]
MAVKSLVELCTKIALDNISRIESLANMPVKAVQEILAGIRSSAQLLSLEEHDEELRELTAPHWQRLIHKDFPILKRKYNWVPKRPEEWHKVYKKYEDLEREQDAEAIAKLQNAFAAKKKEANSRQASLLTLRDTRMLPRLPKDGGNSFGSFRAQPWGSSSGGGSSGTASSSRPKDGKSFLQKARREARDLHNRHANAVSSVRMAFQSQITHAPQSMIDAKRIERQYDPGASHVNAPTIRAPRRVGMRAVQEDRERKEREARLLSIKNGGNSTPGNVISFDDDDDEEAEGDLFGDLQANSSSNSKRYSPPSSPDMEQTTHMKHGLKRRHGFLSASPGANKSSGVVRTTKVAATDMTAASNPRSPPGKQPQSSISASKPAAKSGLPGAANNSAAAAASAAERIALDRMKRKPSSSALFVPKKRPRT